MVPSEDTPRIQEVHITLGHVICQIVEDILFEVPRGKVRPGVRPSGMKILGIDPGSVNCGYGLISAKKRSLPPGN